MSIADEWCARGFDCTACGQPTSLPECHPDELSVSSGAALDFHFLI